MHATGKFTLCINNNEDFGEENSERNVSKKPDRKESNDVVNDMVKEYSIRWHSPDTYLVTVSEYKNGKFKDYREHIVSFKKLWLCDCKGYHYRKTCNHIKWVLSQLKDEGGIIQWEDRETWQNGHLRTRVM